MLAKKVAGLAQNNLVFNILAAKLKKEPHGEKMPSAHRTPSGTLTCWQSRDGSRGPGWHCAAGQKPFRMTFQAGRHGLSYGEDTAGPGFFLFFLLESSLGYILALGPEVSETPQPRKNCYLRTPQ